MDPFASLQQAGEFNLVDFLLASGAIEPQLIAVLRPDAEVAERLSIVKHAVIAPCGQAVPLHPRFDGRRLKVIERVRRQFDIAVGAVELQHLPGNQRLRECSRALVFDEAGRAPQRSSSTPGREVLHLIDFHPARGAERLAAGLFRRGIVVAKPFRCPHPESVRLVPRQCGDALRGKAIRRRERAHARGRRLRVVTKQPGFPDHPNPARRVLLDCIDGPARQAGVRHRIREGTSIETRHALIGPEPQRPIGGLKNAAHEIPGQAILVGVGLPPPLLEGRQCEVEILQLLVRLHRDLLAIFPRSKASRHMGAQRVAAGRHARKTEASPRVGHHGQRHGPHALVEKNPGRDHFLFPALKRPRELHTVAALVVVELDQQFMVARFQSHGSRLSDVCQH